MQNLNHVARKFGKNNVHAHNGHILSAGFQRKTATGYKNGVQLVGNIPYTQEEQESFIPVNQMRHTILMLCKDQNRNPNLNLLEHSVRTLKQPVLRLPDANIVIGHCVRNSEFLSL